MLGEPGASPAPSPSASPAPSASASTSASARPVRAQASKAPAERVHRALVDCDHAGFYNWPAFDTAPSPASYPAARMGDAFDVIGDAHIAFDGQVLYETTIDVVHPWGNGTHYWIAARCVNAV